MTPEAAVARLAEIVAKSGDFTEDDIYASLAKAGVPDASADRAYKFTQTAWGRAVLAGKGVRFPPDYLCFDGRGEVIESGQLAQEPYFVAAMRLAPQYAKSPGFSRLVRMSADFGAVNSALQRGSKPGNLAMGPAAFFLEAATPEGVARAQKALAERAASARRGGGSGPAKPGASL